MSARVISFATQKGGSGKTTMLMLTAAAMHTRTDKRVLVIDADPQKSVKQIYMQEANPHSYDVFAFNWNQPNPEVNFEKTLTLAKAKYDVIFIDVPGRMNSVEMYYSVIQADALVIPIVASVLDVNATRFFLENLPKMMEGTGRQQEVYGVINKKDKSLEAPLIQALTSLGLELFYSSLSNLVRYRRGVSTYMDVVDPTKTQDEFNMYFDEFRTKCFV